MPLILVATLCYAATFLVLGVVYLIGGGDSWRPVPLWRSALSWGLWLFAFSGAPVLIAVVLS